MKTKITFLLLSVLFGLAHGQINNYQCATQDDPTPDPIGAYSYATDFNLLTNKEPVVFNIFFWGINRPNGHNDFPNRANDVLQAVANLNILYNQFNIFFKYTGYEEFNSPYTDPSDPTSDPNGYYILEHFSDYYGLRDWAAANGYKKENAFNVYAFGWGLGFGGIGPFRTLTCGVRSSGLTEVTFVHEIGHNLNIMHTRSTNENTTRDPNNMYFNADMAGDRVVDTAANSGFYDTSCSCLPFIDTVNCTYIGEEIDPVGVPYEIFHEDVINAMSDAYACSTMYQVLSPGQGIRAREAIAEGHYDVALTDISALYEPYQGEYFVSGAEPTPGDEPLFQPGFDYYFYECCCDYPEPSDYNDISFSYNTGDTFPSISKFETDFGSITHPNHSAIYIKHELDGIDYFPQPRKCYDNWNLPATDGSITKFNDGVFNTNVTITPKDSLGINNPNLIQNLDPGLYKIEKNYTDGATEETVVVKGNN